MPRLTIKQGILSPPPAELLRRSSNVDPDAALLQPEEIREKSDDRECCLPSIGGAQVRDENARWANVSVVGKVAGRQSSPIVSLLLRSFTPQAIVRFL